jgi:hypothetical protein
VKPLYRGAAVAVLQCLMVLSIAGKYARGSRAAAAGLGESGAVRSESVRAWTLHEPELAGGCGAEYETVERSRGGLDRRASLWVLVEQAPFFIAEHVPDPSRRGPGEELWVEVSVPAKGIPRPIRLGVRKDGVLTPLEPL